MAISLYDMSVPTYLQTLGGVAGFLEKGLAHCHECKTEPGEVVEHRLFQDMAPFSFQIRSVAHHSAGAMEALKSGVFNPPGRGEPLDYAGLQKLVADTKTKLEALKPDDVNALEGKDVAFQFGETKIPFVAETFLLSFSLPNFHFHATTAYDILRSRGVPLGKRDYMGRLRIKSKAPDLARDYRQARFRSANERRPVRHDQSRSLPHGLQQRRGVAGRPHAKFP